MAFVDLTKAFDTVSRLGLYMVLHKSGCPLTLIELIVSFHDDMKATDQFDGSTLDRKSSKILWLTQQEGMEQQNAHNEDLDQNL